MITFKSDGVLGSKNNKQISLAAGQVNGWAQLTFLYDDDNFFRAALYGGPTTTVNLGVNAQTSSAFSATYHGLPVVGFAVQAYNNNVLVVNGKNVQSTYGADFVHRYKDAPIDFGFIP